MSKLEGKVAIVTGASKGIGAAIAKLYGAEGAKVVVNYNSSKEGADRVVAEIEKGGGLAIAVQADMSKPDDVTRLFEESHEAFGRLDILVNNAGIFEFKPLEAATEDELRRHLDTNVLGPILAIQAAAGRFGDEGGSVINISTGATRRAIPGSSIYAASKSALEAVTRVLAKELGPKKIRVNTLSPGGIDTEGSRSAGFIGSDFQKQMIAETPLGRFGEPQDIAKVALFFASEDSSWVTGEALLVSGGFG